MDRITEGFLAQFVAEHELTTLPVSQQFEHLAAFITVRRHYNGESFDTTDIHTGGGGDTGINAVAILVIGSLVTDVETLEEHTGISGHFDVTFVFVQADRGSSFDGKKSVISVSELKIFLQEIRNYHAMMLFKMPLIL